MGCGMVARGPHSPLYTNEFTPPCHDLVPSSYEFPEIFPPSGIIKNENGSNNKDERAKDYPTIQIPYDEKGKPVMIKNHCWKMQVNRIGEIIKLIK